MNAVASVRTIGFVVVNAVVISAFFPPPLPGADMAEIGEEGYAGPAPAAPAESLSETKPPPAAVHPAEPAQVQEEWRADFWGGVGYWSGDVTYQIGRTLWNSDGTVEHTWFPESELKWPLGVVMASVGGSVSYREQFEGRANCSMSVTESSGKLEDSDWTEHPDVKDVYSECDADLNAWALDSGIRWWFWDGEKDDFSWSVGAGGGYLHQNLDWRASNYDMRYPQEPWKPHERGTGVCIKYKATLDMPYLEVAGRARFGALGLLAGFGYAPYLWADDEDDHFLSTILSKTDADGTGWKLNAEARYDFECGLFLLARLNLISFDADGREKDYAYDGPSRGQSWETYHEITSTQADGLLALGYGF